MKPILFNTEMTRAILDGRKTVTRRVIKPQPTYSPNGGFSYKGHSYGTDLPPTIEGAAYNFKSEMPYQPGDILYVRETWRIVEALNNLSFKFEYAADGKVSDYIDIAADRMEKVLKFLNKKGWLPSLFMPREAARIFLKVTNVRVERLQDITSDGIEHEGTNIEGLNTGEEYRYAFYQLWNSTVNLSTVDRYGWEANPFCWVIEFERCEKEVEE